MSKIGHNFPPPDALPIPEDVRPGPGWTDRMVEMADHIGAYRTLLMVDRFGGMRLYIPADPKLGKCYEGKGTVRDLIGAQAAAKLSEVYGREYFHVPTAKHALSRARRGAIIASVREGEISGAEAARILGTSRSYLAYLVNQTGEGLGDAEREGRGTSKRPSKQMQLFDDEQD